LAIDRVRSRTRIDRSSSALAAGMELASLTHGALDSAISFARRKLARIGDLASRLVVDRPTERCTT